MLKLIIYPLFLHLIRKTTSSDSTYEHISTISFPDSLSLDIERNILSTNNFNLESESDSDFEMGSSYSKIVIDESKEFNGQSSFTFADMIFIYWEPEEVLSSVTVSISNGNCASPMIFSSKSVPIFRVIDNVGKLELRDEENDFLDRFGSNQQMSDSAYTTKEIGSKYFYINIICFYYLKVKFRSKIKEASRSK